MKRHWTRDEVEQVLKTNDLGSEVSYLDRKSKGSPDNWIVYMPLGSAANLRADNVVHLRSLTIQVVHMHRGAYDSIAPLVREWFQVEPSGYATPKDTQTDYWSTYYEFQIFAGGVW